MTALGSLWNHTVGGMLARKPSGGSAPLAPAADLANLPADVRRMIRDGRYCQILAPQRDITFDEASLRCAARYLEHALALVPAGEVCLINDVAANTSSGLELVPYGFHPVTVEATMMDRTPVTNDAFALFVKAGGYESSEYWPSEILPNVLQFVDSSGCPGPRYWHRGEPPAWRGDHPVVGICWFEAQAYARWAGKMLPTAAQWQRAGTWAKSHVGDALESRYPWGNAFDPKRANLRSAGIGATAPVDAFPEGRTPNGISQLVGNVWEWTATAYQPEGYDGAEAHMERQMAEIRGGAFDTYFHSQATCQFRTGQPLFARAHNVGFRCCIAADRVCADRVVGDDPIEDFE